MTVSDPSPITSDEVVQKTNEIIQATSPAKKIVDATSQSGGGVPPRSKPKSFFSYDGIVKPAVDSFMLQVERIARAWTKDPIVLCCLIRNLAALGGLDKVHRKTSQQMGKFPRKWKDVNAQTLPILLQMRAILDLLINFLQKDIDTHLKLSTDFLSSMMLAIVGAAITTLDLIQQFLREEIFILLKENRDSVMRRCWPLDALIDLIIKTIMHPVTGLFVKLDSYILDWTNKIKQDIGMKYNCSTLEDADREIKELKANRDEVNAEIEEHLDVEGADKAIGNLTSRANDINRTINAVKSRISVNKGIPIIGQAGCYLRKVEVLQNLRFFRNTIDKVVAGLDKGILCMNLTDEQIANSPNPANDVIGISHPAQRYGTPRIFPTDDEMKGFVVKEFDLDGDTADVIIKGLPDVVDVADTDGLTEEQIEELIEKDVDGQIRAIETLADCTQVISDELIIEVNDTLTRLET